MTAPRFKVGDHVQPKPEWIGDPNEIPTGVIRSIAPFGKSGALYVGDDKRAFIAEVFDHVEPEQESLP